MSRPRRQDDRRPRYEVRAAGRGGAMLPLRAGLTREQAMNLAEGVAERATGSVWVLFTTRAGKPLVVATWRSGQRCK